MGDAADDDGTRAPLLELVEYPAANVRCGALVLQGCGPVGHVFTLALRHYTPGTAAPPTATASTATAAAAAGVGAPACCELARAVAPAGTPLLGVVLLHRVTRADGHVVERVLEDGVRGNVAAAFDPHTLRATRRIVFSSAGRGAPWVLRFVALVHCAPTGTTSASASAGATTHFVELCRRDVCVRTFSKKAKIDQILHALPGPPAAAAAHKRPRPACSAPANSPAEPEPEPEPDAGAGAATTAGAGEPAEPLLWDAVSQPDDPPQPAPQPPPLLPLSPFEPAVATPTPAATGAAPEGARRDVPWWTAALEDELAAVYERVGAAAGATFTRALTAADLDFIAGACAGAGPAGACAWVARTAAELAKVARLWNAAAPQLVAGLVPRARADALLGAAPPGTFIVRLSSGEPGELVVAVAMERGPAGTARTEQCYLRQDGEPLDERVVVARILANRALVHALDCRTGTLFSKDLFRPRGRYAELAAATSPPPPPAPAPSAAASPPSSLLSPSSSPPHPSCSFY